MKRFLSMLLVLCMVVTTLMGVMMVDVGAVSFSLNDETEVISLQFGAAKLPATLSAWNHFAIGSWQARGSTFAEADIDAFFAGTATEITATRTPYVNFLETSIVENSLDKVTGEMTKYDFKEATITDNTPAAHTYATSKGYDTTQLFTQSGTSLGKISPNYSRISTFPQKVAADKTYSDYSWTGISKESIQATATENTAYVFTFYAYTQNVSSGVGNSMTFELRNPNSSISIPAADLVSTNGIPHKVDIVLSADDTKHYAHLYIDGVEKATGKSYTTGSTDIAFQPRFELSLTTGEASVSETDWYITQFSAKTAFTSTAKDTVSSNLFVTPNYTATTKSTAYRTNYITGVDADLKANMETVLNTEQDGDKIVDIPESKYNSPAVLFTDTANTNVKLINKTTGAEVAVADTTGTTMDDYLLQINGVYVMANKIDDPITYMDLNKTFASTAGHDVIAVRMKHENFTIDGNVASPAYGGMETGFVRFTDETRGSFYFSNGGIYYNQAGYRAMTVPGMLKLSDYNVAAKKSYVEFDIYVPEYTAGSTSAEKVRFDFSGFRRDSSVTSNTRTSIGTAVITTNGKTSGNVGGIMQVDVPGNAWTTLTFELDATNTATTGKLAINAYVNGVLTASGESSNDVSTASFAETSNTYITFLEHIRFYTPKYSSVGLTPGKWYVGDYTPTATPISQETINAADVSGITVYNDTNLMMYDSDVYTTEEALIEAMENAGYTAVYEQVVNQGVIEAKYKEVDGDESYTSSAGTAAAPKTYTGLLVKRWLDSSYTDAHVVASETAETGSNGQPKMSYEIINTNIVSATDNGDGTATMVVGDLDDMTVYPGIAHSVDEIVALLEEDGITNGRTQQLVGFAVTEEGKLPRIYSLQASGTELYALSYDTTTDTATLTYREFDGENKSFVIVVSATDDTGKAVATKVSEVITIDASEADGIKTKTFTPALSIPDVTKVKSYKVFVFDSLTSAKPMMANAVASNPDYVAPVEPAE